ncbi:SLC13 family permease [Campylobacter sp. RM9334]|uniref:SLC13 family permease n=1 Tax=Campylobacter sp. RM9334 TaxID=2735732 RepID=UPI001D2A4CEA|nr:SLC13 family permease [Campylobacter sp. RM9334]
MKIIVGCSILVLILSLIFSKIKPSILFGILAIFYYIIGYLDLNSWLVSYTSNSLIVLIILLLVSIAIEKSIIIDYMSKLIINKNYLFSLLKLGIISMGISAFLNNTAVVASFMGAIKNNKFQPPSKLLIPLSYFSILGGTMTLVGTSTNLVVNSFVMQNNLPSLKIFDFFYVGFLISIFCLIGIIIFNKLLPKYEMENTKEEKHLISAKVLSNSDLIGKSIADNGLRKLEYLFLFEIQRNDYIINPVSRDEIIQENDILIFSGDIRHINMLHKFKGINIGKEAVQSNELELVDVLISQESSLIGQSVKESNFRTKFNASIISFKRGNQNISKIGNTRLEVGDRLILSVGKDFKSRDNIAKNFHILSSINQNKKLSKAKSILVFLGFVLSIALSALELVSLLKAMLILLCLLVFFKIITINEIKRQFPFDIFIIIGSSLAITKVLVNSGLADDLGVLITHIFGAYGVYGSFIGIYLFTLLLTEIMTNNAAAALSFPIAYSSAIALDANPTPFIFAVAYGASAAFLFPHSYQTHLMVSSICGYKLQDFLKIGWIISIIYSSVVIIATPIFFNF